jgi:predicted flap endonuclease-1-like 5' DNA nuclease
MFRARLLFIAVAALLLLVPSAAAQGPIQSLKMGPTNYYLLADGKLNTTTPNTPNYCMAVSATTPTVTKVFRIELFGNGSWYPYPEGDSFALKLQLSTADGQNPARVGSGFMVNATLKYGDQRLPMAGAAKDPPETTASALTVMLHVNDKNNVTVGQGGMLELEVKLTAKSPGGPLPGVTDVAIACDVTSTVLEAFQYGRGAHGAGDIDGDGIPDAEDADRDDDEVLNVDEAGFTCVIDGQTVEFADRRDLQPGKDSDGDGFSDDEECAAGSNPLDRNSIPPQPKPFPWGLLITLFVVVLLVAGAIFLFMHLGAAVTLTATSQAELIVEPGSAGRYQVTAESKRKSGDPVSFQLAVDGMPDGWDAKTDVDHIALGPMESPEGRAVFHLVVESPEHTEPESAVVTVRAIPLNKQGRKDTFKRAGKLSTITSINVPADAKVPVRRGGPVKLKSGEEQAAEAPTAPPMPSDGIPVADLPGVSAAQAKKLQAAGVEMTEQLRTADVAALAKSTKIGSADLGLWQQISDLIRVPGVTPEAAKALVEAGVPSSQALAGLKPDDLVTRFNARVPQGGAA